ncbi:RNA polymerase sigma factor [Neolewinella aurantiaca]|uniref:RNA polymerase sigma factor n=1 Tax=Neolewinella aurantiaca TaxID=2602767 RepID=UPI001650025D|nr:sigma-70 family RNA polymerase sigma factor [Neolewinella aurantiaca]
MPERENEAQLLAECRAGKDAAWGRFYQLFGGYVYSLCRRYGVAEGEIVDTVQEVFAQVFLNLKSYDPVKGALKPWVRALAINIVLMHLRKQSRGRIVYLEDYSDDVQVSGRGVLDQLNQEALLSIVAKLPLNLRLVFNLSVVDGYSHREIAERLTISEATSRQHLTRAKQWLRRHLSQPSVKQAYGLF